MRERLLRLLTERSFARRKVILASGKESDFFIDCKQTALLAEGHALVGEVMLERVVKMVDKPVAVAGVELGGCPLASAVALASYRRNIPMDAIYVRKAAKDHGSQRLLEGDTHIAPGSYVALLEDVVTTGGSTLAAAEKLTARGLKIAGVVALVDRLEGGGEAIAAAGLRFESIFTRRDFMGDA